MRATHLTHLLASLALLTVGAPAAHACTAALLQSPDGFVIARNYDWYTGDALVLLNPAGQTKRGLALLPGDKPPAWTSQHASITFNQYGHGFPNGGMNDAGVVIDALWLPGSRPPPPADTPSLNELQLIQYLLDQADDLDELIHLARATRVSRIYGDIHYFACDREARCATLELLQGQLTITTGDDLTSPVLTNTPYADSLDFATRHRTLHPDEPPQGPSSLARFTRAAAAADQRPKGQLQQRALALLDDTRDPDGSTRWQIVYDPAHLTLTFRTHRAPDLKTLRLQPRKHRCAAGTLAIDIDANTPGDATPRLAPLTPAANEATLRRAFTPLASRLPPQIIPTVAAWPASMACETAR